MDNCKSNDKVDHGKAADMNVWQRIGADIWAGLQAEEQLLVYAAGKSDTCSSDDSSGNSTDNGQTGKRAIAAGDGKPQSPSDDGKGHAPDNDQPTKPASKNGPSETNQAPNFETVPWTSGNGS